MYRLLILLWCVVLCFLLLCVFFFFKQKTAYEMRMGDWSSDVCSSDLKVTSQAPAQEARNWSDRTPSGQVRLASRRQEWPAYYGLRQVAGQIGGVRSDHWQAGPAHSALRSACLRPRAVAFP